MYGKKQKLIGPKSHMTFFAVVFIPAGAENLFCGIALPIEFLWRCETHSAFHLNFHLAYNFTLVKGGVDFLHPLESGPPMANLLCQYLIACLGKLKMKSLRSEEQRHFQSRWLVKQRQGKFIA